MPTDTNVSTLILNKLTEAQYSSATKNATELYLTPDTPASTTVLGPVKVDGTTITAQADGTISSSGLTKNNFATLAWNFSSGNYILGKNTLPFESSSAYNFVWHFISPSSTSGNRFMFCSIDTEGSGGGFDIAYNSSRKMYISQSGVGSSGWAFDAAISDALTASTEYWLKMQYDGTTYTYTTATDKDFTNIVSTVTNSNSVKIKNTTSKGKFGAAARSGQSGIFGDGKIFLSDCYLEFDGVKAFDGSKGFEDYSINGGPNVVTVLQ